MKSFVKTAVAIGATLVSIAAHADVTLTSITLFPNTDGGVVSINSGATADFVLSGEIDVTTSDGDSFAAYCIDIPRSLGEAPSTYSFSLETQENISKLFSVAGFDGFNFGTDGVITAAQASGLQLAIWEAVYDGGLTGALTTGVFQANGFDAASVAAATSFLSAAATLTTGYAPYVQVMYSSADPARQTLVTSVPEPSTYALMAACLGVVGFVARRKQTQA